MLRLLAGIAGVALLAGTASAQPGAVVSADELVAKNLAARGGEAAFAALTSVALEGKLVFPGDFQLTYKEVRGAGGAVRVDAALQGLTLVQAWDGRSGWRINPFEGRKDAERMTDDEARSIADTGSIRGPLLNAASDGSVVTYLGREDFDGTETYKLKVAQKDGDEFVYFLDPDSMLEVKMIETRRIRGAVQVTEYEMGDYEKVGAVYFPMAIESGPQGSAQKQRTLIASGVANADAPASLFALPAAPAAAGK